MIASLAMMVGLAGGWQVAAQEATQVPQPANPPVIVAEGTTTPGNGTLAWQVTRRDSHVSPNATPEPFVPTGFVVADTQAVTLSVQGDGSNLEPVPAGDAGFTPGGFRQVRSGGSSPAPYFAIVLVPGPTDPAASGNDPNLLLLGEDFPVPAGPVRLQLWAGRLASPATWTLPHSEATVALLVTSGAIEVHAAGASAPLTLVAGEAAEVPPGGSVSVRGSADAVVYAAVILAEANVTPTAAPQNVGSRRTPTPTPVPSMPATEEPAEMPPLEPTVPPASGPIDSDEDGLTDQDEAALGTNPMSNDSDGDGVFDGYEVSVGLNPLSVDSDGDGMSDYDELANDSEDPGSGDADGDGLTDGFEEQVSMTNPNDADSDDDGVNDGDEWNAGTDPLVPEGGGLRSGSMPGGGRNQAVG